MLEVTTRNAVCVIRMDSPATRNALSEEMRLAISDAVRAGENDTAVRCFVLTGSQEAFSAGGDIKKMQSGDLIAARERFRISHVLAQQIAGSSKPFIAAIEGWCVGAGLGLALLCDTVIAGAGTTFRAGFGKVGLIPDFGLLHTLPARVGAARAKQILLYDAPVQAEEALALGMADQVVAAGSACEAAAGRGAAFSAAAPLPIAFVKQSLSQGLNECLQRERDVQSFLMQTQDHLEAKSAFIEKRRPAFRGS